MKKIISIVFITIICLIFVPNKNLAVLQSNGNTPAKYILNDYLVNVRKMEELGGAMGLTETLNENLTSTTSNNIDVHLERNTEYGAMAILSASSYGNPNIIGAGETTTGNKTGIVINYTMEVTSTATEGTVITNLGKASKRYKDMYELKDGSMIYSKKNGDALEETAKWHNSSIYTWRNDDIGNSVYEGVLIRSSNNSIFDYWNFGFVYKPCTNPYTTRAVVVCGQGL